MLSIIENHRSIRQYLDKPIPADVMEQLLLAATRASTVGTMQLYSIIVTTNQELKNKLAPCHFNQPMVTQAPVVVTICADLARFEQWCTVSGTTSDFRNMVWFLNATIDALLAAQNLAIEAENQNLGICYLGTTLYNAAEICDLLEIPQGVIPVATITLGYPNLDKLPPLTHRLPLEAVVHSQTYKKRSNDQIVELWKQIDNSPQTLDLIKQNDLPTLAHIFTQRRYKADDNILFSQKYIDALKRQQILK